MSSITVQNVFKTIWRRPTETFEAILDNIDDPEIDNKAMPFVALAGIGHGLDRASLRNLGDSIENLPVLIGIASLAGVIGAFIGLYFYSWLFSYTNKWLGGTGGFERIKTALAWAAVPFVIAALFWLPNLILFKMDNFTEMTPLMDVNLSLLYTYLGIALLEFIFVVYCCVIWLKGLGRACGFSAWKALGTTVISALIIIIPLAIIGILFFVGSK